MRYDLRLFLNVALCGSALAGVLHPPPVTAQPSGPGTRNQDSKDPSEDMPRNAAPRNVISRCIQSTKDYYTAQWNRTFDTTKTPRFTIKDAKQERRRFGLQCAGAYSVGSAPDSLLVHLAGLYALIDEDSLARAAVHRSLAARALPGAVRAERLVVAAETFAKDTIAVASAGAFLTDLEQMGSEYLPYRAQAMLPVLALYHKVQWYDRAASLGDTLSRLYTTDPETYSALRPVLARGLMMLALMHADAGRGGSAVSYAERLIEDFRGTPQAATAKSMLPRFRLLGRPAPMVTGQFWLNPQRKEYAYTPQPGQVTVLLFTTLWCEGCEAIARAFERLNQQFAPTRQVQFGTITRINQLFDERKKKIIPPDTQIQNVKRTLVDRYKMSMPIAIEVVDSAAVMGTGATDDEHRYKVDGYPMFALIDSNARVRLLMTGWGPESERRLQARITALLNDDGRRLVTNSGSAP